MINIMVTMDLNNAIEFEESLKLIDESICFEKLTRDNVIVMERKTYNECGLVEGE